MSARKLSSPGKTGVLHRVQRTQTLLSLKGLLCSMVAVLRMDAYRVFLNPIIGLRSLTFIPVCPPILHHFCGNEENQENSCAAAGLYGLKRYTLNAF